MLHKTISIARYTFIANFRNRIFLVLVLFGIMLLASSLLLSILGQEQEIRMLIDLGLASIEVLSLFISVFLMVNIILEEMETRTLYLTLTRSVSRIEYLMGRFMGTMASVLSCALLMTLLHILLLWWKGWKPENDGALYFLSIFMSMEKIFLISSIALFLSLFSSSAVVSWVFTFFFWILGHFAMEMKFLSLEMKNGFLKQIFKGFYFLIPHFQYLNARDLWVAVTDLRHFVIWGTAYTLLYGAAAFMCAAILFRKKEF